MRKPEARWIVLELIWQVLIELTLFMAGRESFGQPSFLIAHVSVTFGLKTRSLEGSRVVSSYRALEVPEFDYRKRRVLSQELEG